jgi:hypothetical protein
MWYYLTRANKKVFMEIQKEPGYDYLQYATRTDEEMLVRARLKELELSDVFEKIPHVFSKENIMVAVLGCPEQRMISSYASMFEKVLKKPCSLVILDKHTEHLRGISTIIKHDVRNPLPYAPFDLIFSHVLLKFIPHEYQTIVLKNSYYALASNGIAIHIVNESDIGKERVRLKDGWYSVPYENIKQDLREQNIPFEECSVDVRDKTPQEYLNIRGIFSKVLVLKKP